jgi:uncharacterized protein (DUF1697 family)
MKRRGRELETMSFSSPARRSLLAEEEPMPVYIALLRGINIGPHKRVKMEKLVTACASCGWTDAKTYIQSGNVVFKAPKSPPGALSKKLETQIVSEFGFSASVIVRTEKELAKIIAANPLLKLRGADPEKLHVTFLAEAPAAEAIKKLQSLTLAPDQVRVAEREIYFYFPNGVSGSSLWKHPLDKVLKIPVTMRNWNTVNQLHAMTQELA